MKPGWKTSEFWVSLIPQVIAVPMVFGLITPETADTMTRAVTQTGGGLISILAAIGYAFARSKVKSGR